jgi:soluble epoxide hydrolase/lipid-phosphate phosphatase
MDSLKKSTLKTIRGFTYTYYTSSAENSKPTILLLHGWLDEAVLWEGLITNYLIPAGYGIVAPDCLGYAGTDKPADPADYNLKDQTADMCEILDKEGIAEVIRFGHDWGSSFFQRLYIYHPERCIGLVNFNVAFRPRAQGAVSLDAVIKPMETRYGYFPLWYMYLFSDPVEGPQLMDSHIESVFAGIHGEPETWKDIMCKKNGCKDWLRADTRPPVQLYATNEMKKRFVERFEKGGFTASLMWHRSAVEGYLGAEEMKLQQDRFTVDVPYLFVSGLKDALCLPAFIEDVEKAGLTPKLTKKEIDCGHWCMLSNPKETGEAVVSWLEGTF